MPCGPRYSGLNVGDHTYPQDEWIFTDERASGTVGGTATIGNVGTGVGWTIRTLNTTVIDGGTDISLASNVLTLSCGVYSIEIQATFHATGDTRIRLRDTTNGTTIEESMSNYGGTSVTLPTINVPLKTTFTVATVGTTFEIQYFVTNTSGTTDLGNSIGITGITEVYMIVKIVQLSCSPP